jgi:hypothetical protein
MRSTQEWLTERGTSTCAKRKSPPSEFGLASKTSFRVIVSLSSRKEQLRTQEEITPSSADSASYRSTGLIQRNRETCRTHLCSQPNEPVLVAATSSPILHHANPALVLPSTNAGPAADQPANSLAASFLLQTHELNATLLSQLETVTLRPK